jgi:hypothetical protein
MPSNVTAATSCHSCQHDGRTATGSQHTACYSQGKAQGKGANLVMIGTVSPAASQDNIAFAGATGMCA